MKRRALPLPLQPLGTACGLRGGGWAARPCQGPRRFFTSLGTWLCPVGQEEAATRTDTSESADGRMKVVRGGRVFLHCHAAGTRASVGPSQVPAFPPWRPQWPPRLRAASAPVTSMSPTGWWAVSGPVRGAVPCGAAHSQDCPSHVTDEETEAQRN